MTPLIKLSTIDLTEELIENHMETKEVWTVANMKALIDWLKTQIGDDQRWEDVEMTGMPVGVVYELVKAASGRKRGRK